MITSRHNDTIQCMAYNPVSPILASCSASDFGLWSPEQKNVQKYRVGSRICSCSWNDDGTILALGLANGTVTLRNRVIIQLILDHGGYFQFFFSDRLATNELELTAPEVLILLYGHCAGCQTSA